MKGTRRFSIDPPATSAFAVTPLAALLASDTDVTQNPLTIAVAAAVAVGVVLVLSVLRTFSDEFARRSRPRVYTLPRPGDPSPGTRDQGPDQDQDGVALVVLMILVIILAAVVVGVRV